jgi:hypothetical protein
MEHLLGEFGKFIYDLAKITFAVAIISPIIKDGSFSLYAIIVASILVLLGSYIIYKGDKR